MLARSIWAVLAGIAAGIVLAIGSDMTLRAAGIFAPLGQPMANPLFVIAAAYRTVYGVLGSYLTARLAPFRPMTHALVLGFLGLIANVAGTIATWDRGPDFGPKWYPLSLVVLAIPSAWLGAKVNERWPAASRA
jgi:drug/metabolite transporter (DMT)-like permease